MLALLCIIVVGILEDLLYNPQLVSGGGCVLTQLAGIITRRVRI